MDYEYRCMKSLNVTEELISETNDHIYNTMLVWRELTLPGTPSAHLFEDYIAYQMKNIVGGLADKNEDCIERYHQNDKCSERIHWGLISFQQFQISQLKKNDMMTDPKVKVKSEQINTESKMQ